MNWLYRTGLLLELAGIAFAASAPYLFDLDPTLAWLAIAILTFVLGLAMVLKRYFDQVKAAVMVLYFPLVPLVVFLFFFVLLVYIKPNFRQV